MNGTSEFYPPRANWLSAFRVRGMRLGLIARTLLRPLDFGEVLGWGDTILAFLLAGYSVHRLGFPKMGKAMMAVYFCCGGVFLIWLGHDVANYSFGLMLSLHVTSILFLLRHLIPDWNLLHRLIASVATLSAVSVLVYWPIRHTIQKHFMPLRTNAKVIVVNTDAASEKLRRGSWVAYHVPEMYSHFENAQAHGTVIVKEGFSFGRIVGLPGDVLRFAKTNFWVNETSFPREVRMPKNTEMIVPEKRWFIWPDLAMTYGGAAAEMQMNEFLKNRALVAQSNFVGTPFASWCFRQQTLP